MAPVSLEFITWETIPAVVATQAESSPFPSEAPMNAIELLTAFSGESETQYEEFFRFSEEARIVGVEIHVWGQVEDDSRLVELVTGRIDCIRHLV